MSKEVGKMVRSRDVVQAEGSARTEGARRATGVRADGAAAGAGSRATVFQASRSIRAIADRLTPSTRNVTTVSNVARRCWRR